MEQGHKLGLEKLKESGLTEADAKKLKISFLSSIQTTKLHKSFKPLASLKISYLDTSGKPLADWPKAKPFYRVRYLEVVKDFSSLSDKKPIRYSQEPNTAPVAYYPQNIKWSELIKDTEEPLIITEGELKAAKACKEGFPTVGLGGVYNWRAFKLGVVWLPSLECLKLIKRNVYICFDSDYQTNPMVCNALKALADELHSRGAMCHLVTLPQLPGLEKVGLDDFLVNAGPSANDMFRELLAGSEPLGLTAPLFGLNDKYVYIQNPGLIVDQKTLYKTTPSAFKEHLQSTLNYQERQIKKEGVVSFKPTSAAGAWLKWPLRNEVNKLTYSPGLDKFVYEPMPMFNTWPGWGVKPIKGTIKPFLDLIEHIFTGAEDGAKEWFLKWCAYPFQNPGTKMFSSAVIHGIKHGTGKSLIGETIGKIYGENYTEIKQQDLLKNSNAWAENRQFVMGSEITGSNKRADADFLKTLITQAEIWIDIKFLPLYKVQDCINYFFTANQPDSFFLEDDDRRYFIHEVIVGPLVNEFYTVYMKWLNNGGAEALFYYFKNLNIKDFNPTAAALKTQAKSRMISNVRSDLAGWVRQLIDTPDYILKIGNIRITKDLFTSKELLGFYDATSMTSTTANGMGRELSRAGFRQVCLGVPIKLSNGSQSRYYAIKNPNKWLKESTNKKIIPHIEAWEDQLKKVKKY